MPGICGYIANDSGDISNIADSINLLSHDNTSEIRGHGSVWAISKRRNDPFEKSSIHETNEHLGLFSGDLIDFDEVPWELIKSAVLDRQEFRLNDLVGVFVISLLDKTNGKLYLVCDQIAQAPLYLEIGEKALTFSSSIATFCRLGKQRKIDPNWIYEKVYCNYAVGECTPIKGVRRLGAASIVVIDLNAGSLREKSYGGILEETAPDSILSGRNEIDLACHVFKERVEKYYPSNGKELVSLTSGFDSQTVLALAPSHRLPEVETYTYGVPGCGDMLSAKATAERLGCRHHEVHFDEGFRANLVGNMIDTIYVSGGLERINRSTLLHAYRKLLRDRPDRTCFLTGISGDHLFRDHIAGMGNVPSLISPEVMGLIHNDANAANLDHYRSTFGDGFDDFANHASWVAESFRKRYSGLSDPLSYYRFLLAEVGPHYFAGESVIANHFAAIRSPYWDFRLQKLVLQIESSTFGFSRSLAQKNKYRECVLQANIIGQLGPKALSRIKGVPLKAYVRNNQAMFTVGMYQRGASRMVRALWSGRNQVPTEDWKNWFKVDANEFFRSMLGDECRVAAYLERAFIDEALEKVDMMKLQKIVSIELVLRLIETGWRRFDP